MYIGPTWTNRSIAEWKTMCVQPVEAGRLYGVTCVAARCECRQTVPKYSAFDCISASGRKAARAAAATSNWPVSASNLILLLHQHSHRHLLTILDDSLTRASCYLQQSFPTPIARHCRSKCSSWQMYKSGGVKQETYLSQTNRASAAHKICRWRDLEI